ncbi:exported hypothetical protein [Candidatus Sulfopaludibacter sp. SbA4]|nr:exported hypothetical protein [Candidatus Sulfopaludibacter sp. SbA4]
MWGRPSASLSACATVLFIGVTRVETVLAVDVVQGIGNALQCQPEVEAYFAADIRVGKMPELEDNSLAHFFERGHTIGDRRCGLRLGRQVAADFVHGAGDLFGVFGIELDGFVVEVEGVVLDEGLDGAEVFVGDADELLELEDGGAVELPHADDAIGLGGADVQMLGAEVLPGGFAPEVEAASRMRSRVSLRATESAWAAVQRPPMRAKERFSPRACPSWISSARSAG